MSGLSLVQTSPTKCGASKYDREASITKMPWTTRGCCAMGGGRYIGLSRHLVSPGPMKCSPF